MSSFLVLLYVICSVNSNYVYNKFEQKGVLNDMGLIRSFYTEKKINCLCQCNRISECHWVSFDEKRSCKLFDQNTENNLEPKETSVIYSKKITNYCVSNLCLNGGECINELNGFHCNCSTNFAGYRCEFSINQPGDVRSMVVLSNQNLATSTITGILNIYNYKDLVLIKQFISESGIYCMIEISNKYLSIGLQSGKIVILDMLSLLVFKEITAHSNSIITLLNFKMEFLLSLSKDNTIKVWNKDNFNLNKSINTAQNNRWYALYSLNTSIVSLAFDSLIIYNEDFTFNKKYSVTLTWDNSLTQLKNGDIAFSSTQDNVNILDSKNWTLKQKVYCGAWPYSILVLDDANLAVGLINGSLLIFKKDFLNNFNLIKNIDTKSGSIFSLAKMSDGKIIAGHSNSLITVWTY